MALGHLDIAELNIGSQRFQRPEKLFQPRVLIVESLAKVRLNLTVYASLVERLKCRHRIFVPPHTRTKVHQYGIRFPSPVDLK